MTLKISLLLAVTGTVKAKGVGERVMQALFSNLAGVTDDNPSGSVEITKSLHGMPVGEVKSKLHGVGKAMLENRITAAAVPRPALWIANKGQQLLVWAAVRLIVANCTAAKSPDGTVDLLALRKSLAGHADELLAKQLTKGAYTIAMLVAFGITLVAWMLVEAFR